MRDLILHVGPQKTGSTFVQSLIARNRALLEAAGLGLAPHFNPVMGCHGRLFIPALRAAGAEAVIAETAAVPGARLLVTDEDLARFLLQPADGPGNDPGDGPGDGPGDAAGRPGGTWAEVLVAAARRHGLRPRLLYVARRQDHLADSHLFQAAKTWYRGRLADFPHGGPEFDHNFRLGRFEAVFGREAVTVLLHRDDPRQDLAAEFFAALGLASAVPRLERTGGAGNRSPSRRRTLFLTLVAKNRRGLPSRLNPPGMAERVVAAAVASPAVADDGQPSLLSPARRRAMVLPYLAGNRALCARHGIADSGAFVGLPAAEAGWTPPAPIRGAEVAGVFRAAAARAWADGEPGALPRLALLFARMAAEARRRARDRADG